VVDIQTVHGATLMSTAHNFLKTYYILDRLGEIRPIVVRAYIVPGLKHDILSVRAQPIWILSNMIYIFFRQLFSPFRHKRCFFALPPLSYASSYVFDKAGASLHLDFDDQSRYLAP
jgi:hypothetical protein